MVIKKWIFVNTFICIICFLVSCGDFDKDNALSLQKKNCISNILSHLHTHKKNHGILPDKISNLKVKNIKLIKSDFTKNSVFYNPKGYKDSNGNFWIIVLKDKDAKGVFYVGNLKWQRKTIKNDELLNKTIDDATPSEYFK